MEENILNELLLEGLNLEEPYFVEDININKESNEIHIYINHQKGIKLNCPSCNEKTKIYDHLNKQWRHIDLGMYRVIIICDTPRVKCDDHGVKLTNVQWAKQRHSFTNQMEHQIKDLATKLPLVHVGKIIGEHDTKIKRIVKGEE